MPNVKVEAWERLAGSLVQLAQSCENVCAEAHALDPSDEGAHVLVDALATVVVALAAGSFQIAQNVRAHDHDDEITEEQAVQVARDHGFDVREVADDDVLTNHGVGVGSYL